MFVVPAVRLFAARNPGLVVDLSLTDDVVDLVAERADVAIRMGDLPDSGLVARKLGQSRRVVCASPLYLGGRGTPTTPADLDGHDCHDCHDCLTFNFRRDRPCWPFRVDGRDAPQPVRGSLAVNNGETMKQLAIEGAGVARLGLFHVAAEIADGRLTALLEEFNPRDIEPVHAVHVGGGPVPHRVRAFIDHMAHQLAGVPSLKGKAGSTAG